MFLVRGICKSNSFLFVQVCVDQAKQEPRINRLLIVGKLIDLEGSSVGGGVRSSGGKGVWGLGFELRSKSVHGGSGGLVG